MKLRNVLVTGTNRASGIGFELVRQLSSLPDPPEFIFAACRDPENAKDLQKFASTNPTIKIIKIDVDKEETIQSAVVEVERYVKDSGLNLLINNAGILSRTDLLETTAEGMMACFKTNAVGPFLVSQAFLPLLKRAAEVSIDPSLSCSKAAIVNVSSTMGSIEENASGGYYSYRVSKAAMNMITRTLFVDLKAAGIMSVAVHPGWVKTDMVPTGKITTTESVEDILKLLSGLDESKNGLLHHGKGRVIPW